MSIPATSSRWFNHTLSAKVPVACCWRCHFLLNRLTSTDMRQVPLFHCIKFLVGFNPQGLAELSSKLRGLLVCASAEMPITCYVSLIYCFLLCFLIQDSVSIPASAFRYARNLTTRPFSLHARNSSLDLIHLPNTTSRFQEEGLKYRVPNTYVVSRSLFLGNRVQVA